MKQISVAPKTYLYHEGTTTLKNIAKYADPLVDKVYSAVEKEKLEKAGPVEFIYFGASNDPEKEFRLQIAIPVSEEKQLTEDLHCKSAKSFKAISYQHKGPISSISKSYEEIYEYIWNNSLKTNEEIREVYHLFEGPDSENNITEIQVGLI